MPGRRAFLIACGCVAAGPALAQIGLSSGVLDPARNRSADGPAQPEVSDATKPQGVVLRIDGWEQPIDTDQSAEAQVWVRINSSWRSDWH